MTIILIVLAVFFTAMMAYKMVSPFLESQEEQLRSELLDEDMRRVEELVALKAMYLNNLRELEFDLETDKISAEDYAQLKRRYERRAAGCMRELDQLHGGRDWRDKIDQELDRRLQGSKKPKKKKKVKKSKVAIKETHPPMAQEIHCPSCDAVMGPEAVFCSQCSARLSPLKTTEEAAPTEIH